MSILTDNLWEFWETNAGLILIATTALVVGLLMIEVVHRDNARSESVRKAVAEECGGVADVDYAGCRARVLDENGWDDPNAPGCAVPPALVVP